MLKYFILLSFFFGLNLAVAADYTQATGATASVTGSSALLLVQQTYRNYLLIQNRGTQSVFLKFDAVQSGTEGIEVPAGGSYEPRVAPQNAIYAISLSGTQSVYVVYGK